MLHPFERFKEEYINGLIKLNKIYIVSQTYTRAFDHFEEAKVNLLFTDYDQKGLAEIHYSAVKHDKYASIINLKNVKHKEKVKEMLNADSKYHIYWAIVKDIKDIKKRIDLKYKSNIRRFIAQNTDWRIGAEESIKPALQVVFGELFIILKRGSQTRRVKFEEIQNA